MDLLQIGTTGHNHLLAAAQKSFRLAEKAETAQDASKAIGAGARLFCMAWTEFPLNGPLAGELVRLSQIIPAFQKLLTPEAVRLAGAVAQKMRGEGDPEMQELFVSGDVEAMSARMEKGLKGRNPLSIVQQAMTFQGVLSRWDWLESFLTRLVVPMEPDIATFLLAGVHVSNGRFAQAVALYEELLLRFAVPGMRYRLATALAGAGDKERSLALLGDVLTDFPEHTSALLFMDSLVFPAKRATRLDGKCVVSIYSYNKAEALARTLDSVLASDLSDTVGDVRIRVLINGSEDDSLRVAEAAKERFNGHMDVVSLPVNIGAPAARNWLLDAARKDGAQWITYLDDDVLVPSDWLLGLASGTEEFPQAGVWGCRVMDATSPTLIQHGDGFLLGQEDAKSRGYAVVMQEPLTECAMPSQFGYRRHAASVTGCCHLFKVETLIRHRGFDLLYSPSQFDDLDLDLRLLRAGTPAAYLGDVAIRHLRVSDYVREPSQAAVRQGENHRAVLEGRHAEHLDILLRTQAAFVTADIDAKRTRLQEAGVLPITISENLSTCASA
ncbi:glycosyltransferase family 2 protein [Pseudodesulfovibrio sediminis]|uniref:Glycosyl transferase family 2 n=1 Tax=Pseudodesulfovibrio sediminis TaxID=2810563 RepID=A0ABN6ELL9_9BACT|nr:glycosyltransferase family 2 protein [Pseudodesulfovibrio sediminis]BCS86905.1 glycosyl transferase family 2 [Pseudodesulfovibrio sediminis]